jgi:hypothetical protein
MGIVPHRGVSYLESPRVVADVADVLVIPSWTFETDSKPGSE